MINAVIESVTERVRLRSMATRAAYLAKIEAAGINGPHRGTLSCGNLAHGFAACGPQDKQALSKNQRANIGIVSAYNDMLSAHQPFHDYPEIIKRAAWQAGGIAQFAGGVPAMCDGVTQGQPGMELSLFSRDVIAMATAVSLSHNMFDAALCLGVCDKIVPGLLIGALSFGHLPVIFVPAGPMTTGIGNAEKAQVRQLYAEGKIGRDELLTSESKAYHGPGTCTFYGTANSNQLLMEFMGLHLPGASFVNPGTPLRQALTEAATKRAIEISSLGDQYMPLAQVIDERSIINGIVGLLSSGGSTNHTLHLVSIARAAGVLINWDDFDQISDVVPLLARVYPNGKADINHFQAAGGIQFMMRELLKGGFLHGDVNTVAGQGLQHYFTEPYFRDGQIAWRDSATSSHDEDVLRGIKAPFDPTGGLKLLDGNLGRAIIKVSAVNPQHRFVEAPVRVFTDQSQVIDSYNNNELNQDVIVVLKMQGPRANGMPELHKLTPALGVLQDKGYKVALVTDGRMSGASGKVPAAIQITPEAFCNGMIAKIQDGDRMRLDANKGELELLVSDAELASRTVIQSDNTQSQSGFGRELFSLFRVHALPAEQGGGPDYYQEDGAVSAHDQKADVVAKEAIDA